MDINKFNKIFLIRAYGTGIGEYTLPYGLLYIKSYLRKDGIDSYIFDRESNPSIETLKDSLLTYDADVIGISAMTMQSKDAQFIIQKIRNWTEKKIIIVGGIHFTAIPDDGFKFGADYVIRGEGEIALHKFLKDGPPEKPTVIEGTTIKNLDEIPMITMDDLKPYIKIANNYKNRDFHIFTARGCPYNCNFCLSKEQRPRGMRYHSIDYIIEFISNIVNSYQINSFFIADDIFVIKRSRVEEFCEKIKTKIPVSLKFHCFTHAGHGDVALYKKMLLAGFHRISLGVEHGNNRILALCGKNTNKKKSEKTCADIYNAGVSVNCLYILGNIKETNQTISDTINFAIHLHKKYHARSFFSFMQPLPGAPIYEIAENYGRYLPKPRTFRNNDLNYIPFDVSLKHMIREMKRGQTMANYNGTLKKYHSIKFLYFFKSKIEKIPGKRILYQLILIIAKLCDQL